MAPTNTGIGRGGKSYKVLYTYWLGMTVIALLYCPQGTNYIPRPKNIFQRNAEEYSWYRGDTYSAITRISSL
jgi:hypothetical protein